MNETRSREEGLTLVEVMVAVLLFGILALGAFAAFSSQQAATRFQQRSDSVLDAARAVLDVVAMQARAAKGGMPTGSALLNNRGTATTPLLDNAPGLTGANCRAAASGEYQLPSIQVVDGGATGPDRLRVLYPDGGAWGQVASALDHATASVTFRTRDGAAVAPALAENEWVLVTDFGTSAVLYQDQSANLQAGSACGGAATDWCFTTPATASPAPAYPAAIAAGAGFLVKAHWIEYRVENGQLMVVDLLGGNSEPAAEAVDDLQVALGYDWRDAGGAVSANGDGWLNPDGCCGGTASDEWIWNDSGDGFPVAGSPDACDLGRLRAVRITLVVRAPSEAPGATATRPAAENRTAGSPDRFYRVVLRSVVALR